MQTKGTIMKLSGTRALLMILLIAVLSEAGCGNHPDADKTADTGKTDITSPKSSLPPPSGATGL
jgi:predicted small lipoprotein YifL